MGNHILIDHQLCTACNLCAEVCPNKILFLNKERRLDVRGDRELFCFSCGQCMAVCPEKAIIIQSLTYEHDFFDLPPAPPDETGFYPLIATRRAIRNFKDKPVPKELLEKIVEAISLAPPGFPPVKIELVVVQYRELIREALPRMIELYEGLLKAFTKAIPRYFIQKEIGPQRFLTLKHHLIPLLKSRMPELKAGTEDTITRNAPAMILFCGDKTGEDIRGDAFIAATYGMLATHALGLGGSIMDLIPPAINRHPALRELFHIPPNLEIITSIIIGYPKYKYRRGIKRSLKSVRWI